MIILIFAVVAEGAVPALIPLFRKRPVTSKYWKAMVLFAVSALLQVALTIGVAKQLFTLDYSLRFAMMGIPSCILSVLLFAVRGDDHTLIAIASPSIGFIIWLFFITAH